jgi:hypothetical protein
MGFGFAIKKPGKKPFRTLYLDQLNKESSTGANPEAAKLDWGKRLRIANNKTIAKSRRRSSRF